MDESLERKQYTTDEERAELIDALTVRVKG